MKYIYNPNTGFFESEKSTTTDEERLLALIKLRGRFEDEEDFNASLKINEAIENLEQLLEQKRVYEEQCRYRG